MVRLAQCFGRGPTRNPDPMASQGVPFVLAVEIPANWKALSPERHPRVDPADGHGEPDLGRATHRQRVETEAGHSGFATYRWQISSPGSRPKARSQPTLADVCTQSRAS